MVLCDRVWVWEICWDILCDNKFLCDWVYCDIGFFLVSGFCSLCNCLLINFFVFWRWVWDVFFFILFRKDFNLDLIVKLLYLDKCFIIFLCVKCMLFLFVLCKSLMFKSLFIIFVLLVLVWVLLNIDFNSIWLVFFKLLFVGSEDRVCVSVEECLYCVKNKLL